MTIGAVGLITEAQQAESYLKAGQADVVLLARELLRNPNWPLCAAQELNVAVKAPNQYERACNYPYYRLQMITFLMNFTRAENAHAS